jgi:hypothetical protein
MVLDMDDPILRRTSDRPDNAGSGMWTLFAVLAAVAVALIAVAPDRGLQTAAAKPPINVPAVTLVQ